MAPSTSSRSSPSAQRTYTPRTRAPTTPSKPSAAPSAPSTPPSSASGQALARTSPLVGQSLARRKTRSRPLQRNKQLNDLFSPSNEKKQGAPPHPTSSTFQLAPGTHDTADDDEHDADCHESSSMARSVHSPSPPSSPPTTHSSPLAPSIPSSLLTSLSPAELAQAPKEVLLALVQHTQGELIATQGRVGELEDERERAAREVGEREREREGWRARWEELMGEQARMEEELAGRVEVLDKLRGTVRDLEREKREATKRYREQAETFEAERQGWHDEEQHYKVRIANLAQSSSSRRGSRRDAPSNRRKSAPLPSFEPTSEEDEDADHDGESAAGDGEAKTPRTATSSSRNRASSPTPSTASSSAPTAPPSLSDGSSTPNPSATELALRAQLDSLSTAHTSLSQTLRTLQTEMADLKRVYQDLQEENESYEILLGEKTLSGEVIGTDLFRKSFQWGESGGSGPGASGGGTPQWNAAFGFAGGLEAVGEEGEDELHPAELPSDSDDDSLSDSADDDDDETDTDGEGDGRARGQTSEEIEQVLLESTGTGSASSGAVGGGGLGRRHSRRSGSLAIANGARVAAREGKKRPSLVAGGAVAALGGGGGGLDLAAELEAAQDQEELDEVEVERLRAREERKKRKREEREKRREERRREKERRRVQATQGRRESCFAGVGEAELHAEIRQLREANKALTLYVSKIVDRVCSQEGFEKVLAVDYREKTPKTGASASPPLSRGAAPEPPAKDGGEGGEKRKKPRPASVGFFRSASAQPAPATPTNPASQPLSASQSASAAALSSSTSSSTAGGASGPRKSGGLSWDSISSLFGSSTSSSTSTSSSAMKPLMLSSDSASARRLDPAEEDEDEDDRRERARIRAEMAQLGFEPPPPRPRSSSSATASAGLSPALPALPPRTPEEERQATLQRLEAQEAEAKTALLEGRSSGFTDPPARRLSLRMERRHSSQRGGSISYLRSPGPGTPPAVLEGEEGAPPALGLGIKEVDSAKGAREEEKADAGEGGLGKALRRLSTSWASPKIG